VRDVRPFNARSLVLSVLLGLPAGRLSTPALVRLGELFGIAPGTVRTALSRMVSAGELTAIGGGYELTGRLLERKAAQDAGRRPPPARWDGAWWIVAVTATNRPIADRRQFRTRMVNARMGELRPDTWLRPANTAAPVLDAQSIAVRGELAGHAPSLLVAELWDLPALDGRCRTLQSRLAAGAAALDRDGAESLPSGMLLSADVVRFLREEPLLPPELAPDGWPIDELRADYARFDRQFGRLLAAALG
jgi:phenylacetic acid degradation operon negative regulatory protein